MPSNGNKEMKKSCGDGKAAGFFMRADAEKKYAAELFAFGVACKIISISGWLIEDTEKMCLTKLEA